MQRKIISLTAFFSFVLLCFTSCILYIVPEGRVAYWGNWDLLTLSKSQWGAIHITGGLLFIIVSIWHIILNWKSILNYMKKNVAQMLRMPVPVLFALGICLLVYGGTLANVPPMKQLVAWNLDIKAYQAKVNGNPPYGHAELSSLEKFCAFMSFDLDRVLAHLKNKQLKGALDAQTTILELAKANSCTPQQLFVTIKEGAGGGSKRSLEKTN